LITGKLYQAPPIKTTLQSSISITQRHEGRTTRSSVVEQSDFMPFIG